MVKTLLAGILLALSAQAASIQSLPDWEGHAGSVTITATTGLYGTGTLIDQQTLNFIVGSGPELIGAMNGALAIDISNSTVFIRVLEDRPWPTVHFSFVLNGPVETWFTPDFYWGDIVLQKGLMMIFVPPGGQIPEPSTYALMGAGLAALAMLRRRLP